ncbi:MULTISPECIES: hypothetical protein [unclassified Chelatococcus]|uniref:hypothetical protein n=1 Tax=unclassified Chelatococcus TaxID=2638111 RepID=UPI001BD0FFDE|nr:MULTISPECIES: hypothetical protein [unclassified Chelatococcus]MBS7701477.1 hypothetical protein [Chelatococcus sp. YT9]MBX3559207.1 hypothetical protein [Chelatococcus sp.]
MNALRNNSLIEALTDVVEFEEAMTESMRKGAMQINSRLHVHAKQQLSSFVDRVLRARNYVGLQNRLYDELPWDEAQKRKEQRARERRQAIAYRKARQMTTNLVAAE